MLNASETPPNKTLNLTKISLRSTFAASTVQYLPHGLSLSPREVPTDEVIQLQFLLAWTDAHSDQNPSTWFAVDQRPRNVVHQLLHGTG